MIKDSFYRELNDNEIILANMGKFNFDHPDAFDYELMESVLQVFNFASLQMLLKLLIN